MLSEKITSELILNEEKEKTTSSKKKASKKKKGKKGGQGTTINEAAQIVEINKGSINYYVYNNNTAEPEVQKANKKVETVRNGVQTELKGYELKPEQPVELDLMDAFVIDIKDLESQQKNGIKSPQIDEHFQNHIAEASTTNGSEADDKNDKLLAILERFNKVKNQFQNTASEMTKISKPKESISQKELCLKIDELKSSQMIEDWDFDQDKKISKSMKKKLKRKTKKKADEELRRAQLEEEEKVPLLSQVQDSNMDEAEEFMEKSVEMSDDTISQDIKSHRSSDKKNKEDKKPIITITTNTSAKNNNNNKNQNKIKNTNNTNNKSNTTNKAKDNKNITPEKANAYDDSNTSSESEEEKIPEELKKDSKKEDLTINYATTIITEDFDDTGFIEVKTKKKDKEEPVKEKKGRGKKSAKETSKKKKSEQEVKKNTKEAAKPKPVNSKSTTKESISATKTESANSAGATNSKVVEKVPEKDVSSKSNVGVAKIISSQVQPKKLPTVTNVIKSNTSEPQKPLVKSKSEEEISTAKIERANSSNMNDAKSQIPVTTKLEKSNSAIKSSGKVYHPLSIASPCIDFETIKVTKAKEYGNEIFRKKFEEDIFKYISALTLKANEMTNYRMIAYNRLNKCIADLFPSKKIESYYVVNHFIS